MHVAGPRVGRTMLTISPPRGHRKSQTLFQPESYSLGRKRKPTALHWACSSLQRTDRRAPRPRLKHLPGAELPQAAWLPRPPVPTTASGSCHLLRTLLSCPFSEELVRAGPGARRWSKHGESTTKHTGRGRRPSRKYLHAVQRVLGASKARHRDRKVLGTKEDSLSTYAPPSPLFNPKHVMPVPTCQGMHALPPSTG